jgi:hypothetical protein
MQNLRVSSDVEQEKNDDKGNRYEEARAVCG